MNIGGWRVAQVRALGALTWVIRGVPHALLLLRDMGPCACRTYFLLSIFSFKCFAQASAVLFLPCAELTLFTE